MFTYYLAKANQNQLLREAKQGRLIKTKRAKSRKPRSSRASSRGNRRLRTIRA